MKPGPCDLLLPAMSQKSTWISGILWLLLLGTGLVPSVLHAQLRAPAWYLRPPEHRDRVYGAAAVPRAGAPARALELAQAKALEELARRLTVQVEGTLSRRLLEISHVDASLLQEATTSQVQLLVHSVLPENRLEQRMCPLLSGHCFVLVSVSRRAVEDAQRHQEEALSTLSPLLEAGLTRVLKGTPTRIGRIRLGPFLSERFRVQLDLPGGVESRVGAHLRARSEELLSRMGITIALLGTHDSTSGDYRLTGNYREEGKTLYLSLRLEDSSGANLLGVEPITLARDALPFPDEPLPEPPSPLKHSLLSSYFSEPTSGQGLEIAPARGHGARYRLGELLEVRVRTRDGCHLRLYTTTADGRGLLLYPNHYHLNDWVESGETRIPDDTRAGYELPIEPPRGLEVLKAVCSSRPFLDAPELRDRLQRLSDFELLSVSGGEELRQWIRRQLPAGGAISEASTVYLVW